MPAVFLTNQFGETFTMCEMCSLQAPHARGEWQCWQCDQWYYSSEVCGRRQTPPVYDREQTADLITQQAQVTLDQARHFLEAQGQHYAIDFGWRNAMSTAEALGYVCRER